jgi:hypothetical protein
MMAAKGRGFISILEYFTGMREKRSPEGLDIPGSGAKIPPISGKIPQHRSNREIQQPDI